MKKEKEVKTRVEISKADLHIHTNVSDGRPTPEDLVDWVAKNTDLNVIAITDHDEVDGAFIAQKYARKKKYDLQVIIGEEITAKEGHIIGLFLKEKIRPGMSAHETIEAVRKQGAVVVAAHPFFQTRLRSYDSDQIDGVGGIILIKEDFDAVEVVNATPFITAKREGLRAKYLNDKLLKRAEVGASDAHTKEGVGVAFTAFEGHSAEDLRKAIEKKETQAVRGSWNTHGFVRYFTYVVKKAVQISYVLLRKGLSPREPDIIKVPKGFK